MQRGALSLRPMISKKSGQIDALVHALPSSNKRKGDDVSDTENASSSGLRQMPIQERLQAAGNVGVDQALADWVYETGIPFNVFR